MNDKQNDKQRYPGNEEQLAEQTVRMLETRTREGSSKDDQATVELGRLLRDAAEVNLPASNVDLREQLMAELDGGSPAAEQVTIASSEMASNELGSGSTGRRRFWVAAAASGLLLVGGTIAYNSGFVGTLSNVALLDRSSEAGVEPSDSPAMSDFDQSSPEVVFRTETKTRLVPVTRMTTETKTRAVPISRVHEETRQVKQADGSLRDVKVKVPYTENVAQSYTVQVPIQEQVVQNYSVQVPYTADGKRIEKSDYGKYGLDLHGRGGRAAAPIEKFVFPDAETWNGKQLRRSHFTDFRLSGESDSDGDGQPSGSTTDGYLVPSAPNMGGAAGGKYGFKTGQGMGPAELNLESPVFSDKMTDRFNKGGEGGTDSSNPSSSGGGRLANSAGAVPAIYKSDNGIIGQFSPRNEISGRSVVDGTRTIKGEASRQPVLKLSEKFIIHERYERRPQLGTGDLGGVESSFTQNIGGLKLAIEEEEKEISLLESDDFELFGSNTGEQYEPIFENAFIAAKGPAAISTFSIDVDTASYANMRRLLNSGQRPPADSIRLEELVNYFQYDYGQPTGEHPFSVNLDLADCPWQDGHQLLRVGLKGKDIHVAERPATNVVFLIDVSGSMSSNDKLPLLKSGFQMMSQQLGENDRVSIVTYAGNAGVVLTPTNGTQTEAINNAIERLSSGGSTHGSAGIKLAYELAQQNFIEGGVNRVMLATDGDLNVGVTSDDALVSLIKEKAAEGVFLTVLGFGSGNLKDAKLEKLADNGNGMYAYIDSTREARRVLVDQLSGSLVTIAKDVKIQVEFNPAEVKSYRLLGYENRMLETRDFDDDRKDAGEIGAGHTVTAIYQIEPAKAVARPVSLPAGMKYQVQADAKVDAPVDGRDDADKAGLSKAAMLGDLATVALRYKQPEASESQRLEVSVKNQPKRFEEASDDFRFAASVAGFGMYLRGSKHRGSINAGQLQRIASGAIGDDAAGYRSEFIDLIRKASVR